MYDAMCMCKLVWHPMRDKNCKFGGLEKSERVVAPIVTSFLIYFVFLRALYSYLYL